MHRKSVVRMSPLRDEGKAVFQSEAGRRRRGTEQQPCPRGLIGVPAQPARGFCLPPLPAVAARRRFRRPCAGRLQERRRWQRMRLCRVSPSTKAATSRSTRVSRAILPLASRTSDTARPQHQTSRKRRADIGADDPADVNASPVRRNLRRTPWFCEFNILVSWIRRSQRWQRSCSRCFPIERSSADAVSVSRTMHGIGG